MKYVLPEMVPWALSSSSNTLLECYKAVITFTLETKGQIVISRVNNTLLTLGYMHTTLNLALFSTSPGIDIKENNDGLVYTDPPSNS